MAFGRSTGSHDYWYDPEKKEFILTVTGDDGEKSYDIKPNNIAKAAKLISDIDDEDFALYDMLSFLKDNNVLDDDYKSVANALAMRYSDQPPVWLDGDTIDNKLGLSKDYKEGYMGNAIKGLPEGLNPDTWTEDEDATFWGDEDLIEYDDDGNETGETIDRDDLMGVENGDIWFHTGERYWNGDWLSYEDYKKAKESETPVGDIAKSLTANDLGRSL